MVRRWVDNCVLRSTRRRRSQQRRRLLSFQQVTAGPNGSEFGEDIGLHPRTTLKDLNPKKPTKKFLKAWFVPGNNAIGLL
jgi:hypothetical protein